MSTLNITHDCASKFMYFHGNLPRNVVSYIRDRLGKVWGRYSFDKQCWCLHEDKYHLIEPSLKKEFDSIFIKVVPCVLSLDNCYSVLYLIKGAPIELIKCCYKALSLKFHPDMPNGSEKTMMAINVAYETIIKSLEVKS